jgi:hypothetical protein
MTSPTSPYDQQRPRACPRTTARGAAPVVRVLLRPGAEGVLARLAGYADEDVLGAAGGGGGPTPSAAATRSPSRRSSLGDVVLDLGSGAGIDLLLAARKVGPRGKVIGVDMTDANARQGPRERRGCGGSANVELRKGADRGAPGGERQRRLGHQQLRHQPSRPRSRASSPRSPACSAPAAGCWVSHRRRGPAAGDLRQPAPVLVLLAGAISEQAYLAGAARGPAWSTSRSRTASSMTPRRDRGLHRLGAPGRRRLLRRPARTPLAARWALQLTGKVQSVKVAARKP